MLPARVLDALGVGHGDQIELIEFSDGFMLRPRRIDPASLAPLRSKIRRDRVPFDLESFLTPRHRIDTSVLVRPTTGHPKPSIEYSVTALRALIENGRAEAFASNQAGITYLLAQKATVTRPRQRPCPG